MFKYNKHVCKTELKTSYGSICIHNIVFDPTDMENALTELIFEDDNLKHMFAEDALTEFKRRNIYKRFIPKDDIKSSLIQYVENQMKNNVGFYSFLAEGILGFVFRDIYNYKMAKAVIDVSDTLTDSHTGVDSCMYNVENNIIVLGEAKFYADFSSGINKIIDDFKNKSIKNKLESLKAKAENNEESYQIVIKNLSNGMYDELSLKSFMNQKIIFAGFILHSEKNSICNYNKNDFYDKYHISVSELKENINKCFDTPILNDKFEIILVHIPVYDKKDLIVKIIEKSKENLDLISKV